MPDARALEAIAAIPAAESEEQLRERLREAVGALEAESGTFAIRIHRPPLDPLEHVMETLPHSGRGAYALLERAFPGHAPARVESPAPPPWIEAMFRPSAWHLMEQTHADGTGQGLRVAVYAGPGARSTLSLTRARPLAAGSDEARRARDALRLLASTMHVAAQRLVVPKLLARLAPRLTERELTCLHWVAQGKSDGVVATILGVSDSAVHFHMTNVLRKLGVASRTQAVAKAMALGLVR